MEHPRRCVVKAGDWPPVIHRVIRCERRILDLGWGEGLDGMVEL